MERFIRSFNHAFDGIIYAVRTQPNMRTHLIISVLVLLTTLVLRIDRIYVIAIILCIALVVSLELVNTAIESLVDLLIATHHPLAKTAKDAAAGAVLVGSIASVIVGYLVFYQGIINGGQRVFEAVASVPSNIAFV